MTPNEADPLHLAILDAAFAIEGNAEWRHTIRQLWQPFVTEDASPEITIEIEAGVLSMDGSVVEEEPDPWLLADQLGQLLIERALADTPTVWGLHSAVLADHEGALLLASPSGGGKTTLTLALLERGWRYLSDDLAPIRKSDGQVLPFPKPLGLKSLPRWESFRERWSPPAWPLKARGSLPVPATAVTTPASEPSVPRALVFSEFSEEEDSIAPIGTAKALANCGQFVRSVTPETFKAMSETCKTTQKAELTYRTTQSAVELLTAWLS